MNKDLKERVEDIIESYNLTVAAFGVDGINQWEYDAYGLIKELTEREAKLIAVVKNNADYLNWFLSITLPEIIGDRTYKQVADLLEENKASLKDLGVE